jgi:HK97 family phage prohead protease
VARKFTLEARIKSVTSEGDQLKIVGYASTAGTDRVGDVIVPDAWTKGGLDNYRNNPIILFNHDYSKPVGRAMSLEVDSSGLKIEANISPSSGDVHGLIKDGVLSTFSVGFMIKDADYNDVTDGYIIRDAELLEVSVVSVPCNQEAMFSIAKSFKSTEERTEFNNEVNALKGQSPVNEEVKTSKTNELSPKSGTEIEVPSETNIMNPEEIAALVAKGVADAMAADKAATIKAANDAAAQKSAEEAASKAATVAAEAVTKTLEERLLDSFEARLKTNNENVEKTLEQYKTDLAEKSEELRKMTESKKVFSDRHSNADPLADKANFEIAQDAFILSKVLRKPIEETKFGKAALEKFNTQSTVTVGTDRLETTVGTNIERDIWNSLILAPLFREIQMNSASMTFPVMPDAGYAEITGATTAAGSQPNGDVDQRGAGYGAPYQGITLGERQLSTIKMISKSYLGHETEEDSLIPILPLIREAMVRSHARGVENMMLAGNTTQGPYTSGAANGLLKFASTSGRTITAASTSTPMTGAALFGMRKLMGKYGLNPKDVVYIVSQDAYFQLVEDPEFADADLVGADMASKLSGQIGRVYGSPVLMCDEFAPAGVNNYFALALNTRNFIVPRLRGMTMESQYLVEDQHTVMVASQRLGFDEIIQNATSVVGLKYPAS